MNVVCRTVGAGSGVRNVRKMQAKVVLYFVPRYVYMHNELQISGQLSWSIQWRLWMDTDMSAQGRPVWYGGNSESSGHHLLHRHRHRFVWPAEVALLHGKGST